MNTKEFFSRLPTSEVIYYRSNPGNAGDALIAMGTFHLFDELGLKVEFIDPNNFDATGKTVVYAGGGNFNHIYPEARNFISEHHSRAKLFVLLPHTITENEDLLSELGGNVILFAREQVSYDHIQIHARNCKTYIDHDMALHINKSKITQQYYPSLSLAVAKKILLKVIGAKSNEVLPSIQKMLSVRKFEYSTKNQNKNVGNFFRNDVEASGRPIPAGNADLSVIYELSTRSRSIIEYTVWLLLNYIDQFEKVCTDRLHICVAASILGKPVDFYGNSYFKCRAVYEYSLKENYQMIKWHT